MQLRQILCGVRRQQHLIPTTPLLTDNNSVLPVTCVHDSDSSVKTHVSKTTSCCFSALCQIRTIRRSASKFGPLSRAMTLVLAVPTLLVYPVDFLIDYSQYRVQLCGWSAMVESTIISLLCYVIYIGHEFLSVSSSIWPFSSTVVETTQHLSTCQETCNGRQTATLGDAYGYYQRTN